MEEIYNIESELAFLEETNEALDLLLEILEVEGVQTPAQFDENEGLAFARRFPRFLAALHVIQRDLNAHAAAMNDSIKAAYAVKRAG